MVVALDHMPQQGFVDICLFVSGRAVAPELVTTYVLRKVVYSVTTPSKYGPSTVMYLE